jgi:hypothetical protein
MQAAHAIAAESQRALLIRFITAITAFDARARPLRRT